MATEAPPTEFLNLAFDGEGPGSVGPFSVNAGVVIAFVRHTGEGPFSMSFKDDAGGSLTSVDQRPGPYSGERLHSVFDGNTDGLQPGRYTLEVDTEGPWRLRLFQDTPFSGAAPPISFSGVGDGGGGWAELPAGPYILSATHTGDGAFSVYLLDSSGTPPIPVVDAIGAHQGDTPFTVEETAGSLEPRLIAVGVESQGEWEVSITADATSKS